MRRSRTAKQHLYHPLPRQVAWSIMGRVLRTSKQRKRDRRRLQATEAGK